MGTEQDSERRAEAGPLAGAGGYREMPQSETPAMWCRWCGEAAEPVGPQPGRPQLGKYVHARTGKERGRDRHLVAPQDFEPPLWKEAREVEREFGGLFTVTAVGGRLRADWRHARPGSLTQHYTGSRAALTVKLDAALALLERSDAARAEP